MGKSHLSLLPSSSSSSCGWNLAKTKRFFSQDEVCEMEGRMPFHQNGRKRLGWVGEEKMGGGESISTTLGPGPDPLGKQGGGEWGKGMTAAWC